MKHKHCELIKAWADGAIIERLWTDINHPTRAWWMIDYQPDWDEYLEYRIKHEPEPETKEFHCIVNVELPCKLELTFDSETGELKSAEVLK